MAAAIGDRAQQIRNGLFATPLPARKILQVRDLQ
jgi:hypothetical protein